MVHFKQVAVDLYERDLRDLDDPYQIPGHSMTYLIRLYNWRWGISAGQQRP
jgi:hypothetical protein